MWFKILKQFLIIMFGFSPLALAEQKKIVEVERATVREITESVQLIGTVRARQSTLLIAKANGFLDYEVAAGTYLKKGELIAKLENSHLEKHYALTQKAEDIEKKQTDRLKKLSETKASSVNALEAQYNNMLTARKNLTQAHMSLEETYLRAPFDGIVGLYKVYEGAQVQVGSPIVYFYNPNDLIVEFNIPAPLLPKVNQHTKVIIDGQMLKLSHVQKMLDPETHMAPAAASFKCQQCIIGSSKKVELVLSTQSNSMVIPQSAIFLRHGKPHVYSIENAVVKLIPIELGIREKDNVAIVSGLSTKDSIVVKGHHRLYPGLEVEVLNSTDS